jgi:hypothetical protein
MTFKQNCHLDRSGEIRGFFFHTPSLVLVGLKILA